MRKDGTETQRQTSSTQTADKTLTFENKIETSEPQADKAEGEPQPSEDLIQEEDDEERRTRPRKEHKIGISELDDRSVWPK